MTWQPNADGFSVHRWFEGNDPEPIYRVEWENAYGEVDEDDPDQSTPEEGSEEFDTLEKAFAFGRGLIEAMAAISRDWDNERTPLTETGGG